MSQENLSNEANDLLNKLKNLLDDYDKEPNKGTLKNILRIFHELEVKMRDLSIHKDLKVDFGMEMKNVMERIKKLAINNSGNKHGSDNNYNISSGNNSPSNLSYMESSMNNIQKPKMLEGYLKKQGEKGLVKKFKQRYFKQVEDKLYYYANNGNNLEVPKGHVDLSAITDLYTTEKGFDIAVPGRVYRLQVVNGNSQTWVKGIQNWQKYKKNISENSPKTSDNARKTSDGLNSKNGNHNTKIDTYIEDYNNNTTELNNDFNSPSINVDPQKNHLNGHSENSSFDNVVVENNNLHHHLHNGSHHKSNHNGEHFHKLNEERMVDNSQYGNLDRNQLISLLEKKDSIIKSTKQENLKLLKEMTHKNHLVENANKEKNRAEIVHKELSTQSDLTKEYIQSLLVEIKDKDVLLSNLQEKIREFKIENKQSRQEIDSNYKREYRKNRQMVNAQQQKMRIMEEKIKELENELKMSQTSIEKTEENYQGYLKENFEYVQTTREIFLSEEDPNSTILSELDDVKERFFYSLALGLKLNCPTGTKSNSNIGDLYEVAKYLPHKTWQHFLLKNLIFEEDEKKN